MSRVPIIGSGIPAPAPIGRISPEIRREVRGVDPEEMTSAAFAAKEAARWIARQARAPPRGREPPALVVSFGATSTERNGTSSARDPPPPGRSLFVDEARYRWAYGPAPDEEEPRYTGLRGSIDAVGANSTPETRARTEAEKLREREQERTEELPERLAELRQHQRQSTDGRLMNWREGYASGMRRCLVSLLSARGWSLSPELAAQIDAASPTDLAGWFQRALGAEDPEAVFVLPQAKQSA